MSVIARSGPNTQRASSTAIPISATVNATISIHASIGLNARQLLSELRQLLSQFPVPPRYTCTMFMPL